LLSTGTTPFLFDERGNAPSRVSLTSSSSSTVGQTVYSLALLRLGHVDALVILVSI
jgi:hypothetical protein